MVDALIKSSELFKAIAKEEKEIKRDKKEKEFTIISNTKPPTPEKVVSENLRPYQINGITKIFNKWREGKKSILFQMPTGTGKTILFNEIARMGFVKQRKILIVAHRIELIEQITKKLINKGINVGQIIAEKKIDYSKPIQVASIQTLSRREHPEANLIIIDECHHSKANSYKKLWEIYPDAKFLGVTATPYRLSGEGFDDLFNDLIISMSINEFIQHKYLVPVTHYACSTPDLSNVKTRQGDYMTEMLSDVMSDSAIMKDVVEAYKEKCCEKSTIVFAVDVEHSKEITQRFKEAGIIAEHLDATTPKEEREKILSDFKNKKIKVVSNVEIITEGFDFPECEAVILARPTKSLSLYLQMVGRVMRIADGKTEGIILDNAVLWKEHGLSIIDRDWSLHSVQKKKKFDYLPTTEIAMDGEGIIREVNRSKPNEIKGLKLVPLTFELRRLMTFESYVINAKFRGWKLLSAYFKYRDYVMEDGQKLTKEEFQYCKKRLNFLNTKVDAPLSFKTGFWIAEEARLFPKSPFAEQRRETLNKAINGSKENDSLNSQMGTSENF